MPEKCVDDLSQKTLMCVAKKGFFIPSFLAYLILTFSFQEISHTSSFCGLLSKQKKIQKRINKSIFKNIRIFMDRFIYGHGPIPADK